MHGMDRKVFLAIRVDEMSYSHIAARFGINVADVEAHFASSLRIMMKAMDEKDPWWWRFRSEENTSELQSLMRISYAVFCLKKKNTIRNRITTHSYGTR